MDLGKLTDKDIHTLHALARAGERITELEAQVTRLQGQVRLETSLIRDLWEAHNTDGSYLNSGNLHGVHLKDGDLD